jgi:hypothetical protein
MYLPRLEKDFSMNLRRIAKPLSALLLTVGLITVGVAPADAAGPAKTRTSAHTNDTGWGFK